MARVAHRRVTPIAVVASVAMAFAAACAKEEAPPAPKIAGEPPPNSVVLGIHPDDFRCEMLAALPSVSDALGQLVEVAFSPFPAPTGVPKGCNYFPTTPPTGDAGPPRSWSFDLDCRGTALRDANRLIAQYAAHPDAVPVEVGRSGVDHRDTLLLFVDDDADCYVRVLGPGRDSRVALGRLIAAGLTPTNAPAIKHK